MISELVFPNGIKLLNGWQQSDTAAIERLRSIMDDCIAGAFDTEFARPAPRNAVHAGGSINLMTLNMMNALYGMESAEFYKGDAERYVRTTMMTRRLLGMNKMYVSWAVYAFTAEALGQKMMYPDRFPPGSDPDVMLFDRETWQDIETPDFNTGIPKIIDDYIDCYVRLTGMEPILHLSAPYSLAADTFGQEPLLAALVHEPELARDILNHLVDHVHRPWIDHFVTKFPNAWIEMSDASGSPFFIGPQNCRELAIAAIRRLKDENPWGHRVYDANYRGDYVSQAQARDRGAKRRARNTQAPASSASVELDELTDAKHSVCSDYIIRLHDDRVPLSYYEDQAIRRNRPLFAGVGASQVDRNGIADMAATKAALKGTAEDYVRAVKNVAETIAHNGYEERNVPWPGTVYFEDVSSESSFELIEVIMRAVHENGTLALGR